MITQQNIVEIANELTAWALEDGVKEVVVDIPAVPGQVAALVIEYEKVITVKEIRWSYVATGRLGTKWNYDKSIASNLEDAEKLYPDFVVHQDFIDPMYEKEIKLGIILLCSEIYRNYKSIADNLGLALTGDNFYQKVEIPFAYEELPTGDNELYRFRVYTKRQIVRKDVQDNETR